MSYQDRFALVENGLFKNKLQVALWIAATDILNESGATQSHGQRLIWANNALKGASETGELRFVAIRASANVTIGEAGMNASDSDIQFVVNGLINDLI